jgi:hypothetical protein
MVVLQALQPILDCADVPVDGVAMVAGLRRQRIGRVDIQPQGSECPGRQHIDGVPSLLATVEFVGVKAFKQRKHLRIERAVPIADIEQRLHALLVEIVLHGARRSVDSCGPRMRSQMPE